eukprot:s827_g7.t1
MALLCRGLALLCLLPLKCHSYRVVERDSGSFHRAKDDFLPQGTKQIFKGVARSVGRMNQMSQMYRNNVFKMHQRNLHLRASPVKPNLMRDFHQMQRFQNLGKYRFSTFPGRKGGKTLLPQKLMPMLSRRLMSTKEAKQFGKVFRDYMAKRDMKDARLLKGGTKEGRCTKEQMEEFTNRFYGGQSAVDGGLSYNHPTSKFTSLYIVTSTGGDHNGAFGGLDDTKQGRVGLWNMCARLLRMSSLYNVVYKRVNDLQEATDFVKQVKNDPDFVKDGKALKHVTISGHGNPSTLVLGDDRMLSSELRTSGDSDTKALLKELKPALIHAGEARSTVFLDSCSTGGTPTNGGAPLAQLVAEALPGVEIHAFEDIMYPKHVKLQENFVKDAKFQCQWSMKGKCMQASVFMSKPESSDTYAETEPIYSLAETSQSNTSESPDDKEFVFYDGVSFVADPQLCAAFCGRIPECHSFQFVELLEDDEVDLGMCILNAVRKTNESSDESSESSESDLDASLQVASFIFCVLLLMTLGIDIFGVIFSLLTFAYQGAEEPPRMSLTIWTCSLMSCRSIWTAWSWIEPLWCLKKLCFCCLGPIFPSTAADASKAAARPTQDRAMRGGKGGNELDWYMSNMGWFSAMAGGKGGDRYQPY